LDIGRYIFIQNRAEPELTRVADPNPGSGAFLASGSGMEKIPDPGSGIILENLVSVFWDKKYLKSLMQICRCGCGSGSCQHWLREGKNRIWDPGSGSRINIPDSQHCLNPIFT
jgi:hypothetical protein